MTNILMAIAAVVLLTNGFIFLGAILLAWSYYRLGRGDGIKQGRREILVGKGK